MNEDAVPLWQLAANPHRHHEFDGSGSLSSNVTGPTQLSTGDTFHVWMHRFGLPYTIPMRVITVEQARTIAWQHPSKHIWRWTFTPADDGGTWVTETFDYTQVHPILLRAWKLLNIYHANAYSIRTSLQQLHDRYHVEHHDSYIH